MDRLTPRDLAIARFRRNHEYLDAIFDHRKIGESLLDHPAVQDHQSDAGDDPLCSIAGLKAPPSPYVGLSKSALEEQLQSALATTAETQRVHSERMASVRHNFSLEQLQADERARQTAVEADDLEPWERNVGKGPIMMTPGFPYMRARTPDFVQKARRDQQAVREQQKRQQEVEAGGADADPDREERQRQEKESILEINKEHGIDPPAPVVVPQPPAVSVDSAAQSSDAQSGTETSANIETTDSSSDAPASGPVAEPLPVEEQAGNEDTEMVEIVKDEPVQGVPASEQAAVKDQEAQLASNPSAESAALPTESESLTHPLSAEAHASSLEQAADPLPEATSSDPPADDTATTMIPETAPPASKPETGADSQDAAPTSSLSSVPDDFMKAPTPPLDETLADNDAPKELAPVVGVKEAESKVEETE